MAEERIDIVVTDKVDGGIRTKFQATARAAVELDSAVTKLRKNLLGLNGSVLSKLTANINANNSAVNTLARAQTTLQRTQTSLNAAQNSGAIAAAKLATAQNQAVLSNNNASASAVRLITAQNNAAASAARLDAANRKLTQTNNSLSTSFAGVAGAVGSYLSAAAFSKTADAYTNFTNRLNTVSDSAGQLDQLREAVAALARETRSDLLATTDGFVRFDKALRASGAGQAETLRFTETLNKALVTAGRSTGEVSSVVIQLGQALTAGRLQGDEFLSLSENLPIEALDAFAKVLGISRGELKAASTEGKITADVIRKAFAMIADSTDAAFAKSIPTLEQAWTVLNGAATVYIGQMDQALGISRGVGAAIMFVADNFAFFAPILAGVIVLIGSALVGAFFAATAAVWAFTGALLTNPFGLIAVGLAVAIVAAYNFKDEIIAVIAGAAAAVVEIWSGFPGAFMNFINSAIGMAIKAFEDFVNYINNIFNGILGLINIAIDGLNAVGGSIERIKPLDPLVIPKPEVVGQSFTDLGLTAGTAFQRAYNESIARTSGTGTPSGNPAGDLLRPEGPSSLGSGGGGKGSKTQKLTEDQKALKAVYDETIGAVRQLVIDTNALNVAYENGWLGLDAYNTRMTDLGIKALELKMTMGDATWADNMLLSIARVVEGYEGMMAGLTESFGGFFTSLTDGFANSIGRAIVYGDDLGESLREVARSALAELISGIVKLGIQWLLMNTIGAALQGAAVATTAVAAGAAAAAWAPAAALASLATGGTNAAPAAAALTGTSALAATLAAVGGVGFMTGGYTGDGPANKVAGAVHGKEYVFDAKATKKIGVGNLEAIRRNGATASNSGNSSSSNAPMPKITINNNGTPQTYQTQSISRDEIVLIARDQVRKEAPKVVAGDIANPNGRVSKSLQQNTNTGRNRT